MINLNTLETRAREQGDLWTAEINASFALDAQKLQKVKSELQSIVSEYKDFYEPECEEAFFKVYEKYFPEATRVIGVPMCTFAKANYLPRRSGYCLTGYNWDRKAWIDYGMGKNGNRRSLNFY